MPQLYVVLLLLPLVPLVGNFVKSCCFGGAMSATLLVSVGSFLHNWITHLNCALQVPGPSVMQRHSLLMSVEYNTKTSQTYILNVLLVLLFQLIF